MNAITRTECQEEPSGAGSEQKRVAISPEASQVISMLLCSFFLFEPRVHAPLGREGCRGKESSPEGHCIRLTLFRGVASLKHSYLCVHSWYKAVLQSSTWASHLSSTFSFEIASTFFTLSSSSGWAVGNTKTFTVDSSSGRRALKDWEVQRPCIAAYRQLSTGWLRQRFSGKTAQLGSQLSHLLAAWPCANNLCKQLNFPASLLLRFKNEEHNYAINLLGFSQESM